MYAYTSRTISCVRYKAGPGINLFQIGLQYILSDLFLLVETIRDKKSISTRRNHLREVGHSGLLHIILKIKELCLLSTP